MNNQKLKILCVDDEPNILELFQLYLDPVYEVLIATSVSSAMDIIHENSNDLIFILSDYKLINETGFDLRIKMLEQSIEIPFAIVTGFYDLKMSTEGMKLKIVAFAEKPFVKEHLLELIKEQSVSRLKQMQEDKEMVTSFISESSPMLEEIEGLILNLESTPNDVNSLNTFFRLLHTIKGTASCVGLKSLPQFAHAFEDLITSAKEQKISVDKNLTDAFLFGLDRLKYMYDSILEGNQTEFQVKDWINNLGSIVNLSNKTDELTPKNEIIEQKKTSEKISIPIETLDVFLELSGKLTILRNTIYKSTEKVESKYTNDKDVETLSTSIEELCKLTSFVQKQIIDMRKVGAESITRPLKRIVRDTSKELGKRIDFNVHNEDLKVDNTLAKIMSNCLVHLVRNSIDHGIELPEARVKKGKPQSGTIDLTILEEGDTSIVIIKDDGNGIDVKKVLAKALEKKLISQDEARTMTNEDIFQLIFLPGFSTAAAVSNTSGRGVGMDMVKSSILLIGGQISINSVLEKGTTFTLTLPHPKTVLISKTLMVEDNHEIYSIPIEDIVEVVHLHFENYDEYVKSISQHYVLNRYEDIIPLVKLDLCLQNHPQKNSYKPKLGSSIIILKMNDKKIGLIVDAVHDIEESVIRKIKPVLNTSALYSGVTYFGDNELSLVLNIERLVEEVAPTLKSIAGQKSSADSQNISQTQVVRDYFTFGIQDNVFCIDSEKLHRLEIIPSLNIEEFYGNYFFQYRNTIIRVFEIEPGFIKNHMKHEDMNILIIKAESFLYALAISEFQEFITSTYPTESTYSKSDIICGSIIHEEKILYLIDHTCIERQALQSKPPEISLNLLREEDLEKEAA